MDKTEKLRTRRHSFRFLFTGMALFFTLDSSASVPDVYWSGFAFQGDSSAGETMYPISTTLSQGADGKSSVFDDVLRPRIAAVRNESFNIVIEDLGKIGPDAASSIALAFVLDRETVSVEQFGPEFKLLIEISAQALFFDFKEKAVLASYPFTVQYVHVLDHKPTNQDTRNIVEALYLGGVKTNIFEQFTDELQNVDLNLFVNRRMQVTNVSVSEDVRKQLPAVWREHLDDFKSSLANNFGRSLSRNQNIPVLPYSIGYAVRNRMATRFANGKLVMFELPEADYEVSLELKKVVKIEFDRVAAGTSYIYGTYLHVIAAEPLSGRVYIDQIIKNGATKIVPTGQTTVDDWPAYQDSLTGLIEQFTTALSNPDKKWASKHIGSPDATADLLGFSKVVMSCR